VVSKILRTCHFFYVFYVYSKSKKVTLRFFALLYTFSQTMSITLYCTIYRVIWRWI